MITDSNGRRPRLTLVSVNELPCQSDKRSLASADLKLSVNNGFSKVSVLNAQQLASWIEKEFNRLTCNGTISKATRVRLDYVPDEKDWQTACSIIEGRGFLTEPHRQEPQNKFDDVVVSIWVERYTLEVRNSC